MKDEFTCEKPRPVEVKEWLPKVTHSEPQFLHSRGTMLYFLGCCEDHPRSRRSFKAQVCENKGTLRVELVPYLSFWSEGNFNMSLPIQVALEPREEL